MTHVVTQSCVGDGSCVYACPVNCIQPTPDDPAFELAEMLHIDPVTCVDCGACVSACPVEAIKPHRQLTPAEHLFREINAAYHEVPRERPILAPVPPRLVVRDRGEPLRVAIVGSGPAAMYAAEELLTIPGARVSVFERRDVPYGLVHAGVAPDHRRTRRVSRQLDRIRANPRLTLRLGVEIGRDLTHDDLLLRHHAVIYAVGAASDRPLPLPGDELAGVLSAAELVAWYNGDPEHAERVVNLSHARAVIVGNGNVALDMARILTVDPETLVGSDISPPALAALRASRLEEVVVVARRGPEHSAFTLPELVGLSATPGVTLGTVATELAAAPSGDPKLDLLRSLNASPGRGRRVTLRYGLTPKRIHGAGRMAAIDFASADAVETIDAGLLVKAIGYRGLAVTGLPYDDGTGTVPNDAGRVAVPGAYVVGWIKRGPTGFIGTNKACARETVASLIADYNAGAIVSPCESRGAKARAARSLRSR